MYNYDNPRHNDIPYSRYIVSYLVAKRQRPFRDEFMGWLMETQGFSEDEARDCYEMASNGKLELEESARKYLKLVR